jgi:PTS system mannose-specific IIA component
MIGVVLFTHGSVASALRDTAVTILGPQGAFAAVDLPPEVGREAAWSALDAAVETADEGDGLLLLVDMFGGTPSNLALARLADTEAEVLTGVNLAMVVRALRKREALALPALAADVVAYGRRNVTASVGWLRTRSEPASAKGAP